MIATIDRS